MIAIVLIQSDGASATGMDGALQLKGGPSGLKSVRDGSQAPVHASSMIDTAIHA